MNLIIIEENLAVLVVVIDVVAAVVAVNMDLEQYMVRIVGKQSLYVLIAIHTEAVLPHKFPSEKVERLPSEEEERQMQASGPLQE
jgi:cytochrome b561